MKSTALARLLQGITKPSHDKRPSIETFADIDTDRLAAELNLAGRGRERGGNEEPATSSETMDSVETQIIERIEAAKKAAHATIEDELRTYAERLAALDFEDRFTQIQHTAPAAVGDFKLEARAGRDDLYALRRNLRDLDAEQQTFRRKHKIDRTARVHGGATTFLKIALLIVMFVVEAFANGNFLAKGSEQGLLGGVTEAISFAALNIFGTFIIGHFGVKQIAHNSVFRKGLGVLAFCFYVAFALGLNLALAHYRDVSAQFLEGGGERVMQVMATSPLQLRDLNSWLFFGLGLMFSVVALIDSLTFSDAYPGYAEVQHRLEAARDAYRDRRAELDENLKDVRDEYQDRMQDISSDLSLRRGEYEAIIANRARMLKLFSQHQEHLERAANVLISVYREANAKTRKTPPPARFASAFSLSKVSVEANTEGEWSLRDLRSRIEQIQAMLTAEVKEIHTAYQTTMDEYQQLDDVVPEPGMGDGPKQA
ncbi:hypothetical protein BA190_06120 [Labrys sp. WJW]|uniref:hypothetical protein n=1 Tax=Labrys sp. WJW TaxID=1737983 RepID=UPI000835EBAB|nr:hypothetical protein [Labrys sp. WJW]OCC05806.1 hypothetical protein BA190_06120 [Labrys sp. WJW]